MTAARSPALVVIDASVLVAVSALDLDKLRMANSQMATYASDGSELYAPGVIVGECLYALCRKAAVGALSLADHLRAVRTLQAYLSSIRVYRRGDLDLASRADQIRGTYGCSHSADGLYLALAERLAKRAPGRVNGLWTLCSRNLV